MSNEEAVVKAETAPPAEASTIQSEIELAKRAFALRNFEDAVDHYAIALEEYRAQGDEDTPEFAEVLLVYGRALLENAIAQNSVLGKEKEGEGAGEPQKEKADNGAGTSSSGAKSEGGRIHFGGDPESDHEGDTTADLTTDADETKDDGDDGEENDEDEPEDDFNAAWDVLDMARAYYDKQEGDGMKLKLAQTYMYLGDVSLETEKFEQAVSDYTSGLTIKTQLLPFYSRQVCEAHYRLSLVLDLTPGKVSEGIRHIEQAIASLQARITVLKERLESPVDTKGKGKGVYMNDPLEGMDEDGLKTELKEVEELLKDLTLKHEDMKTTPEAPPAGEGSGADKALDELLQFKPTLPPPELPPVMDGPVNDLTKLVKKKKKAAPVVEVPTAALTDPDASASKGKRKVEAEDESSPRDKKAKLETD